MQSRMSKRGITLLFVLCLCFIDRTYESIIMEMETETEMEVWSKQDSKRKREKRKKDRERIRGKRAKRSREEKIEARAKDRDAKAQKRAQRTPAEKDKARAKDRDAKAKKQMKRERVWVGGGTLAAFVACCFREPLLPCIEFWACDFVLAMSSLFMRGQASKSVLPTTQI